MTNFKCGSIPSPPDARNFISTAIIPQDIEVPRKFMWPVPIIREQGYFGTCVGFGAAMLKNIQETAQKDYVEGGFSPLFIYSLCKQQDGYPDIEGTFIQLAMDNLVKLGIATEKKFPYEQLVSPCQPPAIPDSVMKEAEPYKLKTYAAVPIGDIAALKKALLVSPVTIGAQVRDSFMFPAYGGWVAAPHGMYHGGHCFVIQGFDDDMEHDFDGETHRKGFIRVANSWGEDWGDKGFGYISYEDLAKSEFVYELWSSVDVIVAPPQPVDPVKPQPVKYWKVQVGAYAMKANAQNMVDKLKAAGFPTYLPPRDADGLQRVQVGAFKLKENAYNLQKTLVAAGFAGAFVVLK